MGCDDSELFRLDDQHSTDIRLAQASPRSTGAVGAEPTRETWFYEHRVPAGQKAYSMTRPIRLEHLQPCIDWWGGVERKGREETEHAWKVTADEIKARGYNLDIKNPHTVDDDHGDPTELLAQLNAAETDTARLRDQLKAILAEALTR